ncbi:MAG TPA: cbb3-type cytochrome c oxidase N-terminal domain-containing protein [Enhygromyxa sp.]|nr:cbb3-type cytochrome c oxidase N-terminal domain-containing protein [Enhygromyxa sp.]
MSAPRDELLDHDYDGIREFDNPLPKWWVYLFYGCIVFAAVYVPYYHFGPGALPREQWADDMTQWWEQHPAPKLASATELEAMAADPGFVAAGQSIYAVRCIACHAADGGGLVGPNLTDEFTIYGQQRDQIVGVVYHGTKNGMLAWKDQLSLTEIYQVSAFVHSLRGATPAQPKQPQGVPIVDTPAGAAPTEHAAASTLAKTPQAG